MPARRGGGTWSLARPWRSASGSGRLPACCGATVTLNTGPVEKGCTSMNIVVGYVMSPQGDAALDAAITEAKLRGGSLFVLHSSRGGHSESAEEVIAYREAGEAIEKRLSEEGLEFELHGYVLGNPPSEDVVRVARENDAELIVIGIRQRSRLGKLILGSTAQEILMDAPCPVLAVKAAEDD